VEHSNCSIQFTGTPAKKSEKGFANLSRWTSRYFYEMFHETVKAALCLHTKQALTCSYWDMW